MFRTQWFFLKNDFKNVCAFKMSKAQMGMFTEIANVDYCFSVCRKQTEVCHFRFPFVANKRKFPCSINSISVCIYIEVAAYKFDIQKTCPSMQLSLHRFFFCYKKKIFLMKLLKSEGIFFLGLPLQLAPLEIRTNSQN